MEFLIDLTKETKPFPHFWERCVGSCHAATALREDWRSQLAQCQRELGFQYVRFHGLLDDDMSVYIQTPRGCSIPSTTSIRSLMLCSSTA